MINSSADIDVPKMTYSDVELPLETSAQAATAIANKDLLINTGQKLHIIEWDHMSKWKFYPLTLANAFAIRCCLYPLGVVKARLQLQKQNSIYKGTFDAFIKTMRNEGPTALYRGFVITTPQLLCSFIYATVYEFTRNKLSNNANIASPSVVSALAGGTATFFDHLIFVPTDIIAQNMMIYKNAENFTSANNRAVIDFVKRDGLEHRRTLGLRILRAIWKIDGWRGFYRGMLASLMLFVPCSMVFWFSYYQALDLIPKAYKRAQEMDQTGNLKKHEPSLLIMQATAGTMGGICAQLVTNPLDMFRCRVQIHRTGYWETAKNLILYEKHRIFYQGLAPRCIAAGTFSFWMMLGYETVKKLSIRPEYKELVVW